MSTAITPTPDIPALGTAGGPVGVPHPPTNLTYDDGKPLESDWHRVAMNVLIELIEVLFQGRRDFFAGGNMFIYFSDREVFNRDFRGPDVFLVKDVDRARERLYWAIWEEGGRYPNLIIELLSPKTAKIDRTTKKDLYERVFHTAEYFLYDPAEEGLEGYRLGANQRYLPLRPNEQGRLWSEELGAWLGTWQGKLPGHVVEPVWLRLFTEKGDLVPLFAELEKDRAEKEKDRADHAQAELAHLQAFLAEKGLTPPAE